MRLLDRYRRLPKWGRALVWLHTMLLVLLLGLIGLVEYARREVVYSNHLPYQLIGVWNRDLILKEFRFTGFGWDEEIGPILRFAYSSERVDLRVEWWMMQRGQIVTGVGEEGLRKSKALHRDLRAMMERVQKDVEKRIKAMERGAATPAASRQR